MALFGFGKSAEKRFWQWFSRNEGRLFSLDPPDPVWLTELPAELKRVHASLVWECSPRLESGRELVISADGILEAFSAVESLVDAAPELKRWTIVRFRPRQPDYGTSSLKFDGVHVRAAEIECSIVSSTGSLGIRMFMPGCREKGERRFVGAALLMLDAALGEYDMECKVGGIEVLPFEADRGEERFLFSLLRDRFDQEFEARFVKH